MKTAEDVAHDLWEDAKGVSKAAAIPFIVQALTACAEERVREAIELRVKIIKDDHIRCAHNAESIRAEALEVAARIATTYLENAGMRPKALAEAIRALK